MARPRNHPTIKRIARTIPWGYRIHPEDPQLLVPDRDLMRMLDIAGRAWEKGTSGQQQIAEWLSAKSGWPITRMGLKKRLEKTQARLEKRARRTSTA